MVNEAKLFIESFTPPKCYSIEIDEQDKTVLIKGPYCSDLSKRLKRLGGYWDGKRYQNRKCFVAPLDKAKSLKRIFDNWLKGQAGRDEQAAQKVEKRQRSEIDRWLGYVRESAQQGRVYQNGVRKLREGLNIFRFPELTAQLNELLDMATNVKKEAEQKPSYGKSWAAVQPGRCENCGQNINAGEIIHYRYQSGSKYLEHVDCEAAAVEKARQEVEAPYRIGGGSGYGYQPYKVGQVLRPDRDRQGREDWPEFLFVVRCSEQFIRYDGMSFGVGDDSGYIYTAYCRTATNDEAAPLRQQIALQERKAQAKSGLEAISQQIRSTGEYPSGDHNPEGERWFDTQDIYGGGDWFVIGPEWIWYVRNNGMDGDDWSRNNVRTGGAGAIGWRVPLTDELVEQLTRIRKVLS